MQVFLYLKLHHFLQFLTLLNGIKKLNCVEEEVLEVREEVTREAHPEGKAHHQIEQEEAILVEQEAQDQGLLTRQKDQALEEKECLLLKLKKNILHQEKKKLSQENLLMEQIKPM
jgi:hypothetical protein